MAQKRIPCPVCSESILATAKKCRFCGEYINVKKTPSILKLYTLWVVSLASFLGSILLINESSGPLASTGLLILILIVIFGACMFLAMVLQILKSLKSNTARKFGLLSLITFFSFFLILFNAQTISTSLGLNQESTTAQPDKKPQSTPKPTESPKPTIKPVEKKSNSNTPLPVSNTGKINCIGPDGKTFQATQKECDDFNTAWGNEPTPDPQEYIRCNIHANCGGGYREMTRASCERVTCCQINNTWEFRDKDQCSTEQKKQSESEWVSFCNNLHNPDNCSTYWDSGTTYWYDCRSDAFKGREDCYDNY